MTTMTPTADNASRNLARADLISLATFSFAAGLMLMAAIGYLIRGNWLGCWIFAGCAILNLATAFIVGRRTWRRVS